MLTIKNARSNVTLNNFKRIKLYDKIHFFLIRNSLIMRRSN